MRLLQGVQRRLANIASGGELDRLSKGIATAHRRIKESDRELERIIEEAREGWVRVDDEQQVRNRQRVRDNCRSAFQRTDTFIKGALRLMTEFCFEQGIDGPISNDPRPEVEVALNEFWNDDSNQESLFCTVAQHRASNQLLVDGDYFTRIQLGATKNDRRTAVRYMPAKYVISTITDPFDLSRVLYFKCKIPELEWNDAESRWESNGAKRVVFYRDIFNADPANDPLHDRLGSKAEENAYLLHTAINAIDAAGFGWPEPAISLKWFRYHKDIAGDQATISKATAALMNVLKVDATSSDIDTLRDELRTRGQFEDGEANENVTAQINLMNAQAELSVNRASSRAGEAETNSRMMRMGGGVGLGVPLHYQGDPDNAGLATARTMDRPTLVHMRAYQSVWIDTYRKAIDFALLHGNGIEKPLYDLPAPRIARQDISEAGKLIMDSYDRGLLTDSQAAASVLDMLGFDNVGRELEARAGAMEAEEEAEPTALEQEELEESSW